MKLKLLTILFVIVFIISSCSSSKNRISSNDTQMEKIDSLLNYCNENGMFNGSIAIAKNDTVIFKKSYGLTEKESSKKINSETLFYLASVSKQFTAMSIMILQEKGLLEYEEPVVKYLPELKSLGSKVTIRQLLNHTSGISDRLYYKLKKPNNQEVIEALKTLKPAEFGNSNQNFRYSNSGYILLASIIEKISGKAIEKFYQDEIFSPLGMTRTFTTTKAFKEDSNKVQPYNIIGTTADYESSVIGPGGIYSTINDLIKWNSGLNKSSLVPAKTLQLAFSNGSIENGAISFTVSNQEFGYGFGWMLISEDGAKVVRHDGSAEGYRSLIRKNLSDNIDIILLTNHGGALAMTQIIDGLYEVFTKSDYTTPQVPLPSMVVNQLKSHDINFVVKKLKDSINEENIPDERILGRLGYTFLNEDMFDEAIGLFELNLDLHPKSSDAHYVLGEAYFTTEQYKHAQDIYKKYLLLRPKSEHAIKRLKLIDENINKIN